MPGCARPATPAPAGIRSCSTSLAAALRDGRCRRRGGTPRPAAGRRGRPAAGRAARPGRRAADARPGGARLPRRRCGTPPRCRIWTGPHAARLADQLRAAEVLAPGPVLEFAHPIVRTAIYESVPPGERALAHARAAVLLERDGDDAERVALHLLRSEPDGDPHVIAVLRAAATAASGRGAPGTAADYLRRALEEPPDPATRPAVLLELGLALAAERSPAAVTALRQAVALASAPHDRAEAALMSARALGLWGHHDSVTAICRDALAAGQDLGPAADDLEAELFASSFIAAATTGDARVLARRRLSGPGRIHRVARLRRPVRDGGRPAGRRGPGPPGPGAGGRPARAWPPARLPRSWPCSS